MVDIFSRTPGSATSFYDYNIPDPNNVPTGLPAAYSSSQTQPFISRMHRAVIDCTK